MSPSENSRQVSAPQVFTEQLVRALSCAERNTGVQRGPCPLGAHRPRETGKAHTDRLLPEGP